MRNIILLLVFIFLSKISYSQISIYDVSINDITGIPIELLEFRGKYILFVNVASECGFTDQYKGLEQLHNQFKDDLVVIGVPCNQFGEQEPGSEEEIQQFCQKNFGVSFLLSEKIQVKGDKQHPLYSWLTHKDLNGETDSKVRWNFQKYMLDRDGKLLTHFFSTTKPMSPKITTLLVQ